MNYGRMRQRAEDFESDLGFMAKKMEHCKIMIGYIAGLYRGYVGILPLTLEYQMDKDLEHATGAGVGSISPGTLNPPKTRSPKPYSLNDGFLAQVAALHMLPAIAGGQGGGHEGPIRSDIFVHTHTHIYIYTYKILLIICKNGKMETTIL